MSVPSSTAAEYTRQRRARYGSRHRRAHPHSRGHGHLYLLPIPDRAGRGDFPDMRSTAKARPVAARLVAKARRAGRTRQERGLRTEAAILDATLRSLAVRGIHETSLDLIAAEVGVAKSSILWHFGSKEGLLLRVAERAFSMIEHGPAREILALPTFQQRGEAMWRFYSDAIHRAPEVRRIVLYLIFASAEGRPELRTRLRRLYQSMRALFAAGLEDVIADA